MLDTLKKHRVWFSLKGYTPRADMNLGPHQPPALSREVTAQPSGPDLPHEVAGCVLHSQIVEEIRRALQTNLIGKQYIFSFSETDSTNSKAHELAGKGYPEGTLVLADSQTSGRGQNGRSWHSPPGKGIYLSIILRPRTDPERMPGITLMTAVCLADALMDVSGIKVTIKWPNDLLVRYRKLSGILTEMTLSGESIEHLIVGVGINVAQREEDFPEDIRAQSTSLFMETDSHPHCSSIIKAFLERFERSYAEYLEHGLTHIARQWKELSDMVGQGVSVRQGSMVSQGTVTDIDHDGALIIRCTDGITRRIISGEITMV